MKRALQGDQGSSGSTCAITGAMTWREALPGPFRPTHGFELSWSMLKTWPVRAEVLLESKGPSPVPSGCRPIINLVAAVGGQTHPMPTHSSALRAPQYVAPLCLPIPQNTLRTCPYPLVLVDTFPTHTPPSLTLVNSQYWARPSHTPHSSQWVSAKPRCFCLHQSTEGWPCT